MPPKSRGKVGPVLLGSILVLVLVGVYVYPYLKDSDADGVTDANDAFPTDPSETRDSDHDGLGDTKDFYDGGDGAVLVRVTNLEHLDTTPCGSIPGACDTYFEFRIIWGTEGNQRCEGDSDLYEDQRTLENPATGSLKCSIPDQSSSLTVWILAWDSPDHSYALDYTSGENPGTAFVAVEVSFPFSMNYSFTGNGDYGKEAKLEWTIEATRA